MQRTLRVEESLDLSSAATGLPSRAAPAPRTRLLSVGVLAILLGVLTATTLVACYYAIVVPQQLDEGEPVIYGLATRLVQHQPLYQPTDRPPFIEAYYTPLYFYAVAELRAHFGPGFGPGRALSLVMGVLAAALLAYITASRARSWWAGGFAALLFVGLGFPLAPAPFLALERVDMLGVAFSIAAVAVLANRTSWVHLLLAGVCAGLAVLTKQSLFAAALAGTAWLATLSRPRAVLFAASAALTVLIPALVLQWSTRGAFWDNIGPANLTPTSLTFGAYLLREAAVIQGVPTLLAAAYVIGSRAWRHPTLRLIVCYWLASMISVAGIAKMGANHNYWIELAAANAVLVALGIGTATRRRSRAIHAVVSMLPIWLLAAHLAVLTPARLIDERSFDVIPLSWTLRAEQFSHLANEAPEFNNLVRDVSGEKGAVLSESMDIAVLGDQPLQIEPFAFSMLEAQGRWSSEPLLDQICAGKITLLVLSYPIDKVPALGDYPAWPRSVAAALHQAMQFEQIRAFHWLYRSRPAPEPAAIARCKVQAASARVASASDD